MPHLSPKSTCTGCTACASACPGQCLTMVPDENGFTYPELTDPGACIDCRKCERACPVLKDGAVPDQKPMAFAAYSLDADIRAASSSGGVFTEIAREILKEGGCVYGGAYDEQFRVCHLCVEAEQDLDKLRGAKYAQSDLGGCFAEIKEQLGRQRKVLFAGTPCQVAGLKAFLQQDAPGLVAVDFVCHGVPSPMVWDRYVQRRAQADHGGELPSQINLRSKESGWSRYAYSTAFEYADGTRFACKNGENLFMKLFVGDYILRESCSACHFKGCERVSDITLGDFWGIWNLDPTMDDDKGTSLVLTHSRKGEQLLEGCASRLRRKPVTLEQASRENPSLLRSSAHKANRAEVLDMLRNDRWEEVERQVMPQGSADGSFLGRVKRKMKHILTNH